MFEITDKAAEQFMVSAREIGDPSLSLRISARKGPDGRMIYNMGFDTPKANDTSCKIRNIDVVVDPQSVDNVKNMIIDFHDFEGKDQFVFTNPNDVKQDCGSSPSDCESGDNPECKSCKEG